MPSTVPNMTECCNDSTRCVLSDSQSDIARSHTRISTQKIRVSSGTAITLGLMEGFLNAKPTTAYLLTYIKGKCTANCGFCSQAKSSKSRADMLSRVTWPVFPIVKVLPKLTSSVQKGEMRRVCIQALNYPMVLKDLLTLVKKIQFKANKVSISISCQPLDRTDMEKLREIGVERISIPLDASTRKIFERVKGSIAKGPYDWDKQRKALLEAVKIFGKGKVSTHLIVGLGETEKEMIAAIQYCVDNNICPALFSFTPISGTALEHHRTPNISRYRRIQLARHLIVQRETSFEKMTFGEENTIVDFGIPQQLLKNVVQSGRPFITSGCPDCNRPYYNEKPSGPLYNFPMRPTPRDIEEIEKQLG